MNKKQERAELKLIKKYQAQGLEVRTLWSFDCDKPFVYEVQLDFTDAEWRDLCDVEGELLPACCANISAIRDILFIK